MSTPVVCWKLADNYDLWFADVVKGREAKVRFILSSSLHSLLLLNNTKIIKSETSKEKLARSTVTSEDKSTCSQVSDAAAVVTSSSLSLMPSPLIPSVSAALQEPALSSISPYFSIRPSKGGLGAFASRDIPTLTIILQEHCLVEATDGAGHLAEELEKLSEVEREAYSQLTSYDLLDQNKDVAIFKTNR